MSNTTIQLKKSVVSGNVPSSLHSGEIAINLADGVLFYQNPTGSIKSIRNSSSFSTINVNSTLLVSSTPYDILSIIGQNGVNVSADVFSDKITVSGVSATTQTVGVVQLYDGTNSTSNTLAATANAVNSVYQLANAAYTLASAGGGGGTSYLATIQSYDEFVANTDQIVFSTNNVYTPGHIKVYRNGILLENSEYTATNGNNVTLLHAASANDIVTLHYWTPYNLDVSPVYVLANTAQNNSNTAITIAQNAANTVNSAVINKIDSLVYANLSSNTITTWNNSTQVLDSFRTTAYRTVKYIIQVTSGSDFQSSEILLLHDGTSAYITEYAIITTNSNLVNYDAYISSGDVMLLATPVNNINNINLVKTSIVV